MFSYLTDEVADEIVVEVLDKVIVDMDGVAVDVVAAQTWAVELSQPDTHA